MIDRRVAHVAEHDQFGARLDAGDERRRLGPPPRGLAHRGCRKAGVGVAGDRAMAGEVLERGEDAVRQWHSCMH